MSESGNAGTHGLMKWIIFNVFFHDFQRPLQRMGNLKILTVG